MSAPKVDTLDEREELGERIIARINASTQSDTARAHAPLIAAILAELFPLEEEQDQPKEIPQT
jgi:hypothetical protein